MYIQSDRLTSDNYLTGDAVEAYLRVQSRDTKSSLSGGRHAREVSGLDDVKSELDDLQRRLSDMIQKLRRFHHNSKLRPGSINAEDASTAAMMHDLSRDNCS